MVGTVAVCNPKIDYYRAKVDKNLQLSPGNTNIIFQKIQFRYSANRSSIVTTD
jgi:hypothetical protein